MPHDSSYQSGKGRQECCLGETKVKPIPKCYIVSVTQRPKHDNVSRGHVPWYIFTIDLSRALCWSTEAGHFQGIFIFPVAEKILPTWTSEIHRGREHGVKRGWQRNLVGNSSWRTSRGKLRRSCPSVAPLFPQPLKDTWNASQTKIHPRIFGSQADCEPERL